MSKAYSYLALGDSYTIGEGVLLQESFPYQLVQLLRKKGQDMAPPEIIARSGWTTEELAKSMEGYTFLPSYSFVSLLIGVNDQYRNRTVEEFKLGVESLLVRAIKLAHEKTEHVYLLSIPNYGLTPFATDKDPDKIGK